MRDICLQAALWVAHCTLQLLNVKEEQHLAQECPFLFYYYFLFDFWTHEHKISLQAKKKNHNTLQIVHNQHLIATWGRYPTQNSFERVPRIAIDIHPAQS